MRLQSVGTRAPVLEDKATGARSSLPASIQRLGTDIVKVYTVSLTFRRLMSTIVVVPHR